MIKKVLTLALAATIMGGAAAQEWPSRAIKYIVPFGAGGSTDALSRALTERLQQRLGQPLVVENIGGVGGTIGMTRLARAEPDGYTIGLGNSASHTIAPNILSVQPYDPLNDFTPISLLAEYANILVVNAELPVKDIGEFIALAKKSSKPLTYGSAGVGASNHLTSEILGKRAAVSFTHIPYKGNSEAMTAVAAGHVDWMFATVGEVKPFVDSGKVRAIGSSGNVPEVLLPGVPPIANALPGFRVVGFMALFAPAKLPQPIAARLNKEIGAIVATPEIVERYRSMGLRAVSSTQAEAAARVASEYALWKAASKAAGVGRP